MPQSWNNLIAALVASVISMLLTRWLLDVSTPQADWRALCRFGAEIRESYRRSTTTIVDWERRTYERLMLLKQQIDAGMFASDMPPNTTEEGA